MNKQILANGNEAVGWGSVSAGCLHFFGYPITPQNEIPAWFAKELPKIGGVFVQSQSEVGSSNLLYGACAAGVRALTSTSSPGWSLMLEGVSHMVWSEVPCLIVLVQRGGPGAGTMRHAQMDYTSATRGGGHGGYKTIVLAPNSVQEIHDLVQLGFHLADKYRNPVVILSDGILGQMSEMLEVKSLDFDPLPEKDWAVRGKENQKDGKARLVHSTRGMIFPDVYLASLKELQKKYQAIVDSEVKYETYMADDADLLLVAYGYVSRVSKEAVNMARAEGIKLGLIRPITLWPFPYKVINEKAANNCKFLVVEDSLGQMVEDVKMAVGRSTDVNLLDVFGRHLENDLGIIFPERVIEEVKKVI